MKHISLILLGASFCCMSACKVDVDDSIEPVLGVNFSAISFAGDLNEDANVVINNQADEDAAARHYSIRLDRASPKPTLLKKRCFSIIQKFR